MEYIHWLEVYKPLSTVNQLELLGEETPILGVRIKFKKFRNKYFITKI